ncbi:MAG: urea transporter [Sphingomonadaceae bacterium]
MWQLVSCQLRGVAQIYLQESPLFGAAVLLGLYLTQPVLALGCMLGGVSATATAWVLGFPDQARGQGLYSFNAALIGAGLCAGFQLDITLAAWIVISGAVTAMLSRLLEHAGVTVLTSLFVGVIWLSGIAAPWLGLQPVARTGAGGCSAAPAEYLFCVVGQVSYIGFGLETGAWLASALGMLVWMALARRNWAPAESMLAGGVLGWLASSVDPAHGTGIGINCALTMLALASFGTPWHQRLLGATCCILFCLAAGQAYLTLPFVLATWVVLSLRGRWRWNTIGL